MRIILISLVIINSLGYDWLHTYWHFRNDPGLFHVTMAFNHVSEQHVIASGRNLQQTALINPGACRLAAENDDHLVNTAQPFHMDWFKADFPGYTAALNFMPAALRGNDWTNPNISGFHSSIFQPPKFVPAGA